VEVVTSTSMQAGQPVFKAANGELQQRRGSSTLPEL
jgi:hypothetical protein